MIRDLFVLWLESLVCQGVAIQTLFNFRYPPVKKNEYEGCDIDYVTRSRHIASVSHEFNFNIQELLF